jgi:hypothetical protein
VSHDRWKRLILPAFGVVTKVAAETLKSFHFANVVGAVLDIHTAQPGRCCMSIWPSVTFASS